MANSNTKQKILESKIIVNSEAKNFEDAILEWFVKEVIISSDNKSCCCGQSPIKDIVVLINTKNQKELVFGKVCANLLLRTTVFNKIFDSLMENRVNRNIIKYAYHSHIISLWEFDFIMAMHNSRKMLLHHEKQRSEIVNKILKVMKPSKKENQNDA